MMEFLEPMDLWHELDESDKATVDVIARAAIHAIHTRAFTVSQGGTSVASEAAHKLIMTAVGYQFDRHRGNAPSTETPQ